MTGSRSNNRHSTTQESTLDTLSRTIEDLEEKILGQAQSPHNEYAPRGSTASGDYSLSDEIRARQQSLASRRTRPQGVAQMPGGGAPASNRLQLKMNRQKPAVPAPSHDLSNIVSQLRSELRQDMQMTLKQELGQLQNEMIALNTPASGSNVPATIGADLEAIAQSLKELENGRSIASSANIGGNEFDSLRLEVDSLRNLMDTVAKEDTLLGLDNRWSDIERTLQDFNPHAIQGELSDLATRLEDIRHVLAAMPQSDGALRPLEEKVELIASAITQLMERPETGTHDEQFAQFTSQTDARLSQLAQQIEQLANMGEHGVADRLEAMSARLNDIANDTGVRELEERLAHLQASLDNQAPSGHSSQLDERLLEIANKVDALDNRAASVETAGIERLVGQLAEIAHKLDERSAPPELPGLDRLENQLTGIADRLENSTGGVTQVNTDGLQQQIAQLSELMSGASVDQVGDKLSNLEEHLNTNDEFVLEAARQAAEATLEAYQRSPSSNAEAGSIDGANIAALTSDLKQLEHLYRESESRNSKSFGALQDTLLKIADRLEAMENSPSIAVAKAPQKQATQNPAPNVEMPKAAPMATSAEHIDDYHHEPEIVPEAPQEKPARGASSLLAGLTERIKRDKSQGEEDESLLSAPEPRAEPSALDELESEFADELLEPGSGAPDINSIMQKMRDVQKQRSSQTDPQSARSKPTDYVASARKAALAAAAEVGAMDEDEKPKKTKKRGVKEPGGPLVRKPILIAAGAILLAILAVPLAKNFIGGSSNTPTPQVTEVAPETIAPREIPLDAETATAALDPVAPENTAPIVALPQDNNVPSGNEISQFTTGNADGPVSIGAPVREAVDTAALGDPVDPAQSGALANGPVNLYADAQDLPESVAPVALKQAALDGDPVALYEISARYTEGRGTEVKLDEAVKWLKLSSDLDFAPAQYRLGNFYEKGTGVDRDIDRARVLYQSSATNGNINAMHNLGVLLASTGNAADFTQAADWFLQAAERGVRDSQVNVAILYARGEGVPRNLSESYKWFAIAANQGDADAASKRDEVFNALPQTDTDGARELVANWKPTPLDVSANNVQVPDSWIGEATNTASVDMKKAIMNIQAILNNNGFDTGRPDGIIGAKTTNAIKEFQASIGMKPDGQITDKLVQELLKRNG
ncbi:MAG: SEL1-like repeat protein [Rhizobiaceae bacterium]|nr:SEL1-like repeat protein [Rhizobiaceae bacterium]